jgi:hypothetical protein
MENKSKTKSNKSLIVIILIMSLVLIFLIWDRFRLSATRDEITQELIVTSIARDSVKNEFNSLLETYETLETANDTLNEQLKIEKEKIREILIELEKSKAYSNKEVQKYKKELETLRGIMRGYVVQVDSLNTLNQKLIAENIKVTSENNKIKNESKEISAINQELEGKVNKAAELRAREIRAVPLNDKNNATDKLAKFIKLKVCFIIDANKVVEPGLKTLYLRIADPSGVVLYEYESNVFNFNGKELVYSSKKRAEYNNTDLSECIYWDYKYQLKAGKYSVDVFMDSQSLGSTSFVLK